LAKSALTVGW